MKSVTLILQNCGRLLGLVLLILGFLFWSRHAYNLVPLHTGLAVVFVLILWTLSFLGLRARLSPGLVAVAFVWGFVVLLFGGSMGRLLPGRAHELIRVLHFLIALTAIGLLETLGGRIKRRPIPAGVSTIV